MNDEKRRIKNNKLIERFQNGDKEALNDLCKDNKGFIRMKVLGYKNYLGSDLAEEDLIQEGYLGFIKAAERFDVKRGYSFLTYAGFYVASAARRACITQGLPIRVSDCMITEIVKLIKADRLFQHLHGEERIMALSDYLNVSNEKIRLLYQYTELLHLVRADKPMDSNDENLRLSDFFTYTEESYPFDPEEIVCHKELNRLLKEAMSVLNEKEREVIMMNFGFLDGAERTLEDIGKQYGVTRERVRQIREKALRKIRFKCVYEKKLLTGYEDYSDSTKFEGYEFC